MTAIRHICLLGFGEVGSLLAAGFSANPDLHLRAWDWQFDNPHSAASRNALAHPQVLQAGSARQAASACDLIISAVTAAQALPAAQSILPSLEAGAWFLDLNSISPRNKQAVASELEAAGGKFIEAAVMSPIAPEGSASPILVGGPHAEAFLPLARQLGFTNMRLSSSEIGRAAATKMCRSVVVKGVEALLTEALLSARSYGVEEDVLASLGKIFPHPDWQQHARYMISRSLQHGVRRAEEMREASLTVANAGIEPLMSEACVARQDWAAQFAGLHQTESLPGLLDSILGQIQAQHANLQSGEANG
jgi:3-hydroxyisobutyrate dehydrogenase-like beta-hydroxyacid dehydrogenase